MVETGDGGGCSQQAESVRPKLAAQRQLDEGTQSACFVPGARFGHTYLRVPRTCRMRVSTRRSLSSCTGARPMLACTFMPARHGHLRAPPDRQSPFIPYHPGVFGPLLEGLSWWKLPLSAGFWFAPVTLITARAHGDRPILSLLGGATACSNDHVVGCDDSTRSRSTTPAARGGSLALLATHLPVGLRHLLARRDACKSATLRPAAAGPSWVELAVAHVLLF